MPFHLRDVVPWGRSFDEYVAMFSLTAADLSRRILGCGDGPAAFNAEATRRGASVVSADPIYQFAGAEIRERIDATAETIAEQTREHASEFVWTHAANVDALIEMRMTAMRTFLADFDQGRAAGRYVAAELPRLPFAGNAFGLALCSHFLFLYSAQHDADFHIAAIEELCRVASAVRVFPLLELGSVPSRHLACVLGRLRERGYLAERVRVAYEFQRGGYEMLEVRGTT